MYRTVLWTLWERERVGRSGPFFPGSPDPLVPLPAQRQSEALVPAAGVRHISHRRFLATFPLVAVSREDQDLYRCVSQAPRGAGVSNFAELIVKGERAVGLRGAGRAKVGGRGFYWGRSLVDGAWPADGQGRPRPTPGVL